MVRKKKVIYGVLAFFWKVVPGSQGLVLTLFDSFHPETIEEKAFVLGCLKNSKPKIIFRQNYFKYPKPKKNLERVVRYRSTRRERVLAL